MTRPARGQWTPDDLRALPVIVDLATAGSILNMGLTKSRSLAASGHFPVPVIRHGDRYVVPTAALRALLGVPDMQTAGGGTPAAATTTTITRSDADDDTTPARAT